jgi:ribosomal protein L16 Arg81 hydroxylase
VITGKLTMRFADHEEVFEAGDAWYAPPGHTPVKHEPGTEIVQFSPTQQLAETEAVMARNMQAMQHH